MHLSDPRIDEGPLATCWRRAPPRVGERTIRWQVEPSTAALEAEEHRRGHRWPELAP
jgi:hypothetical protein